MTADRPRLYPGHRHEWEAGHYLTSPDILVCKVCGFESPRTLANLDGAMLNDAVYDEPDTDTDQGGAT